MERRWYLRLIICGLAGSVAPGLIAFGSAVSGAEPLGLRRALEERYRLSGIEIESSQRQGAVVRRGVVLTVQMDGVPANPLRVIRPAPWSPRDHAPVWPRHLRNYARFEISKDGAPIAEPATFTLPRGRRVIVLEMKVERDAVRLFTHTVAPVALPGGLAQYGCTEFVFRIDPEVIQRADVTTVDQAIERWLARAA
jgi:hypothetical protein